MVKIGLYKHQRKAVNGIRKAFSDGYDKCLVKMFCGTGKTRIVFYEMMNEKYELSVIVFPTLALVTQFNNDYLLNDDWSAIVEKHSFLSVCSEKDGPTAYEDIHYTTDPARIKKFAKVKGQKIISVTYQSLETLITALGKRKIDLMVFDEAHHVIGDHIQDIAFNRYGNQTVYKKAIFLTATPKNGNGITMLERDVEKIDYEDLDDDYEDLNELMARLGDKDHYTDCGVLAYEYSHLQAVQDGRCNDFNIAIEISRKGTSRKNTSSAIARCIFKTGNKKCLTFHGRSETAHETLSESKSTFLLTKKMTSTEQISLNRPIFTILDNGTKVWWLNGKLHREDGPAIERANGDKEWWLNDKCHREDGPAVEYANGTKAWYLNGQLHREDGPAVEEANGDKEWWLNGKLHREDEPAVEEANGDKEWWLNGQRVEQFTGFIKSAGKR